MAKKKHAASSEDKKTSSDTPNFENSLSEVEQIVSRLESGSLGLSESLEQYESGIRQLKHCHQILDAAEQKVSLLAGFDADGNPIEESLSAQAATRGSSRKASVSTTNKSRDEDDAENQDAEALF